MLAPFIDIGIGRNTDRPDPDPNTLTSVGMGILWNVGTFHIEVYWAVPQVEVVTTGDKDLQDDGIHFELSFGF